MLLPPDVGRRDASRRELTGVGARRSARESTRERRDLMMKRGRARTATAAAVSLVAALSLVTGCSEDGVGSFYGDDGEAEEREQENGDENDD